MALPSPDSAPSYAPPSALSFTAAVVSSLVRCVHGASAAVLPVIVSARARIVLINLAQRLRNVSAFLRKISPFYKLPAAMRRAVRYQDGDASHFGLCCARARRTSGWEQE